MWQRAADLAAENHSQFADVSITAADGSVLRAWSIVPATRNGDAVILLHGQADNRAGMLGPASLLLRHGYAVLLPDARAHGESGGAIATYGVLEADEIHRWFAWIRNADHPDCIDGIGDSMGAAQLLRSLDAERGYCSVVAESSFSSFWEVAYDRMGQWFGTGAWLGRTLLRPAIGFGFLYARLRYGINFAQASPLHAVAASATPVLLIHGLADTNIPPRHSEQISRANPATALWEPANADHCGASSADPAGYESHVLSWLATHDHH
jgi:dipeptidyl aminopeptidase/acylaminoacyl peptidase